MFTKNLIRLTQLLKDIWIYRIDSWRNLHTPVGRNDQLTSKWPPFFIAFFEETKDKVVVKKVWEVADISHCHARKYKSKGGRQIKVG